MHAFKTVLLHAFSLHNRPGNMGGPTLPVIGNPMRVLFLLLEFLPTAFFMAVMWIFSILLFIVFLCKSCKILFKNSKEVHKMNKEPNNDCWQCCNKGIDGLLGTITVLVFPTLFSMRHISVPSESRTSEAAVNEQQASERKHVKEILFVDRTTKFGTYDSRKTPKYSGLLIQVFGMLGTIILLLSAGAFFRYFPVTLGSECVEEDAKFNTWFCYHANASRSDQAINCTLYNINNPPDESNSSALICYAISGELAKPSAAAYGLYKISSLCVLIAVHIALKWGSCCGKAHEWISKKKPWCENHPCEIKLCYVLAYSSASFAFFLIITIIILLTYGVNAIDYTPNHYFTGEFVYRLSILYIFLFLAIFFLVIPCNMLICYEGINSSYYFLASEGEEEFQTTEPDSES